MMTKIKRVVACGYSNLRISVRTISICGWNVVVVDGVFIEQHQKPITIIKNVSAHQKASV